MNGADQMTEIDCLFWKGGKVEVTDFQSSSDRFLIKKCVAWGPVTQAREDGRRMKAVV